MDSESAALQPRCLQCRIWVFAFRQFTFLEGGLKKNYTEGNVNYDLSGGGQSLEDEAAKLSGFIRKDFTEKTHRETVLLLSSWL